MTNKNIYRDSIDLVHRHLECIKYIGGERNNIKTGEGFDINIAILPDLLLDYRSMYLQNMDNQQICTIGGRSGRTACSLLHLLSNEDEIFNCYLITKTGNLGRLLLENEFKETSVERIFNSKYTEYIIDRPDEPRTALRYLTDKENNLIFEGWSTDKGSEKIKPSIPRNEHEIGVKDLKNNSSTLNVIQNATTIYLSSIKCPNFIEIFDFILEESIDAKIFLDTSRGNTDDSRDALSDFIQKLEEVKDEAKIIEKIECIFLPDEIEAPLLNHSKQTTIIDFVKRYKTPIISYGKTNNIKYINVDGTKKELEIHGIDFHKEDIPERFKAGILLAASTYNTITKIKNLKGNNSFAFSYLIDDLINQWEKNELERWRTIIEYGISLASVPTIDGLNFSSLESLLKSASSQDENIQGKDDFDHYPVVCRSTGSGYPPAVRQSYRSARYHCGLPQ